MSNPWIKYGSPSSQDYYRRRKRITKDIEMAPAIERKSPEASLLEEVAATPPGILRSLMEKKLAWRVRKLFLDRTDSLAKNLVTEITQALLSSSTSDVIQMLLSTHVFHRQVCDAIDRIQTALRSHQMQQIETCITSSNAPSTLAQCPRPTWFDPPIVKTRIRSRYRARIFQYTYRLGRSSTLNPDQYRIPIIWTVGVKNYPQGMNLNIDQVLDVTV